MVPTLHTLLQSLLQDRANWRLYLMQHWPEVVGALHTKMSLEKICNDHTLLIGVHDAHWMQELYYLSSDLVATINKHLPTPQVRTVRFVLSRKKYGTRKRPRAVTGTGRGAVRDAKQLTNKQTQALRLIDDPQLQEALQFLIQHSK